jgi:outer membrane biosynthesis protein TonB
MHAAQDRRGLRRWIVSGGVALLLQLPMLVPMWFALEAPAAVHAEKRPTVLRLSGQTALPQPPDAPEVLPENAQVVEVAEAPEDVIPEESEPTNFVADRKVRHKKQTRAKRKAAPSKNKRTGVAHQTERSKVQSADSKSAAPTQTPQAKEARIELALPDMKLPEAAQGVARRDSLMDKGRKSLLQVPPSDRASQLANIQGLSGAFAGDDHIPEIETEADNTLLNADRYRYADFFYRVKNALRHHWQPAETYRRRDPTGELYGVKDRHTVFRVTLDPAGHLKNLLMVKDSGLRFLDDEARTAFHKASPFTNPPEGLVDRNDEIVFQFGFYFEIESGHSGLRWRRF